MKQNNHSYHLKIPNFFVIIVALFVSWLTVYVIDIGMFNLDLLLIDKFGFEQTDEAVTFKATLRKVFNIVLFLNLFPFFLFLLWNIRFNPYRGWKKQKTPFVSIIIPAFNEQYTITKSIQCALDQNYPEYEVIVVDDGSSDFTPLLIDFPEVKSIHMERNQGKAAAVNKAIETAKGEYLLFSDSDSHLHKNAIRELIKHFDSPDVGAVCGKLIVRNPDSLIVCWQSVEYIFSQAIMKIAQNGSGSSILVCPGPICMYERKTMIEIGGFKERTIVEDFDMTLEITKIGKLAVYEPNAVSWTSTPKTFKALKGQRKRWYRGTLQALRLYKDMFFNRKFGMLGCIWLPYLYFWGFGGAVFEALLLIGSIPMLFHFYSVYITTLSVVFFLIFEAINIAIYIFSLFIERQLSLKMVIASILIKPYSIFIKYVILVAIYYELRNKKVTWS
ncbi:MAG: hypothetical protein COV35_10595 [Alphaproteobacteria bacterium CG11_big_fil_rev_8_21_14_0_20_39_49]|nr:MAG: hypothetical protein COV35_10595 [Alphaproteobacteria bacterium CG11_big_fil_rev_8_21_14_0_20_39_49]